MDAFRNKCTLCSTKRTKPELKPHPYYNSFQIKINFETQTITLKKKAATITATITTTTTITTNEFYK